MNLNKLLSILIFMILDWVSFLAYPNLFGIKGFVVVAEFKFQKFPTQHSINISKQCNMYYMEIVSKVLHADTFSRK
jgi:hypothetical protein